MVVSWWSLTIIGVEKGERENKLNIYLKIKAIILKMENYSNKI